MPPALRVNNVTFRYLKTGRRNVLDNVSIEIDEGKITLVMGGSGCGKSTLAAVAAGLYPENGGFLESGTVEIFGTPLSALTPQRRAPYLAMMFQNPDLQFCMSTLRSEMRFCMENILVPPREMDGRAGRAAEEMGVTRLLDRRLQTLSGGEKQLAALSCLSVMESRCVVLDEPFANIDPDAAEAIVGRLSAMRDAGRTVIAIDHRLDLWLDVLDEIIVLGGGAKVVQRGITRENLSRFSAVFREQGLSCGGAKCAAFRAVAGGARNAGAPAVSFRGLSIRCGDGYLLQNANADFPRGGMTAVLGASGSGKTTTFLAALGRHPHEGTILIDGKDTRTLKKKELYRTAGIVFQNPANQFITQSVEEEIKAGIRVWDRTLPDAELNATAESMLSGFGLLRYRHYSPYMLSQGQQRRLAVLSVLAGGQRILFLDEPTYGQDFRSTESIMEALRRRVGDEGLTVVFSTHDRGLAASWADRIYLLENGTFSEVEPCA